MIDPVEFGKQMGGIVREAVAPLLKRIELLESRQPERGEKGDPGENGKDAEPIDVSDVVAELVASDELKMVVDLHVAEAVAKYFAENPVKHGKDGEKGDPGIQGEKGDKGDDGVGNAGAMIDRDGVLIITTSKGETIRLGCVVGKDGKDGERGKDGADLSDVAFEVDGRVVTVKAKGGEVVKSYAIPVPMDAGYWRDGMKCLTGDVVTHDGSAWIALRDTSEKPTYQAKADWRLFARKGRDGDSNKSGIALKGV